jgi:hypothetical protein
MFQAGLLDSNSTYGKVPKNKPERLKVDLTVNLYLRGYNFSKLGARDKVEIEDCALIVIAENFV